MPRFDAMSWVENTQNQVNCQIGRNKEDSGDENHTNDRIEILLQNRADTIAGDSRPREYELDDKGIAN